MLKISTSLFEVVEGLKWNNEHVQKSKRLHSNVKYYCYESDM